MSHSDEAYLLGIKLDFQGVLVLMWSSTIPLIYYSFPSPPACPPVISESFGSLFHSSLIPSLPTSTFFVRAAYWTGTTILASLCSAATMHPSLGAVHLGHYRARLFACFGVGSFVVPIIHGIAKYGATEQACRIGLPWIAATAVANSLGMAAYSMKVSWAII
jgi:adiponectin receptor